MLNNIGIAYLKLHKVEDGLMWLEKAISHVENVDEEPLVFINYYNALIKNAKEFQQSGLEKDILSSESVNLIECAFLLSNANMYKELVELYARKLHEYNIESDLFKVIHSAYCQIGKEVEADIFYAKIVEEYTEKKMDAFEEMKDDEEMAYVYEDYKQRLYEIAEYKNDKMKYKEPQYNLGYKVQVGNHLFLEEVTSK